MQELIDQEHERGLDSLDTYIAFARRVEKSRTELMQVLGDLIREGKEIVGYGASGRATTIMSFCGIDAQHLSYVVDDAPAKHGLFTPGSHLPIKSWSAAEQSRPDYLLLFAWSFADEVIAKRADYLAQGGKFIVRCPRSRWSVAKSLTRVLVLGSTGMLGHMMMKTLRPISLLEVYGTQRTDPSDSLHLDAETGLEGVRLLPRRSGGFDYLINCIGMTKVSIDEQDPVLSGVPMR